MHTHCSTASYGWVVVCQDWFRRFPNHASWESVLDTVDGLAPEPLSDEFKAEILAELKSYTDFSRGTRWPNAWLPAAEVARRSARSLTDVR